MVNKVIIAILMVSSTLCSCDRNDYSVNKSHIEDIDIEKIEIITVDNCEYLIYREDKDQNSAYGFMAHKGNCSNPVHQCD